MQSQLLGHCQNHDKPVTDHECMTCYTSRANAQLRSQTNNRRLNCARQHIVPIHNEPKEPTAFEVYEIAAAKYAPMMAELTPQTAKAVLANILQASLPYPTNPIAQTVFRQIENHLADQAHINEQIAEVVHAD